MSLLTSPLRTTVDLLNAAAEAKLEQHQYVDAQKKFEQVLSIKIATLGQKHPSTAKTYWNIATALTQRGKNEPALEYFAKTVAIMRATEGETWEVADIYLNMSLLTFD